MDYYAPQIAGPQGAAGATGATGSTGSTGATGPRWPFTRQRVTPTTGQTVNADGSDILQITPAGLLLALTVVFPASPANLQMFILAATQTVTTLTLNGNGNTILSVLGTITLGGFATWYYSSTDTTWIRCG